VEIGETPPAVIAAIERVLSRPRHPWLSQVDQRLQGLSWDDTWSRMSALIAGAAKSKQAPRDGAVSA
jgi:hypothetical protein